MSRGTPRKKNQDPADGRTAAGKAVKAAKSKAEPAQWGKLNNPANTGSRIEIQVLAPGEDYTEGEDDAAD